MNSPHPEVREEDLNAAALAVCTTEERLILYLAYTEERSFRAIGGIIGRHHSTVIAWHDAALERIRKHLEGTEP